MSFTIRFLVFVVAIAPAMALGHHSVAVIFDTTSVVEAEGEITELSWRNPHVRFRLSGTNEDGSAQVWNVEPFQCRI